MYNNRRRSHIHLIRQYEAETLKYTGTRVVIFIKTKGKNIFDLDDFKEHRYKNPKEKKNRKSKWMIEECNINDVVKKVMINSSEDDRYFMKHILYESSKIPVECFISDVLRVEGIGKKLKNMDSINNK